jgi:hypothetical protein
MWRRVAVSLTLKPVGANSFAKNGTGNADVSPEQSFANEFAPTDVAGRVSD